MYLLNTELSAKLAKTTAEGGLVTAVNPGMGLVATLFLNCKAWAPYWGIAVGLGAGVKGVLRYIQMVQMNPA
jgi:hypothetical protein